MRGKTGFVIAHRLSTMRRADQIVVESDGRVIEKGTHECIKASFVQACLNPPCPFLKENEATKDFSFL